MGRLGVRFDQTNEFVELLQRFKNSSRRWFDDSPRGCRHRTCEAVNSYQERRFEAAAEVFRAHGFAPTHLHLANSAGIFDQPLAWGNMVRPGGVLYGLWRDVLPPSGQCHFKFSQARAGDCRAAFSTRYGRALLHNPVEVGAARRNHCYGCTYEVSRRTLWRPSDRVSRRLHARPVQSLRVIVRDTYASVIGRVSMDLTLIDVTNVEGVEVGDVVTLLGSDASPGRLSLPVENVAKTAGTLSYELTAGLATECRGYSNPNEASAALRPVEARR